MTHVAAGAAGGNVPHLRGKPAWAAMCEVLLLPSAPQTERLWG